MTMFDDLILMVLKAAISAWWAEVWLWFESLFAAWF